MLIGLGGNAPGPWGPPASTLRRSLAELARHGVRIEAVSPLYETEAMGQTQQPPYVNAVARIATHLPPEALLRLLKRLEVEAGRRGGRPWGARTLDLDILDFKGEVRHWRRRGTAFARPGRKPLVLPHPLLHRRPFVLRPLLDVAPGWRHPVLQRSAGELWARIAGERRGGVLRRLS